MAFGGGLTGIVPNWLLPAEIAKVGLRRFFVVTKLLDTPFMYLARHIAEKHPELTSGE